MVQLEAWSATYEDSLQLKASLTTYPPRLHFDFVPTQQVTRALPCRFQTLDYVLHCSHYLARQTLKRPLPLA